MTDNPAVGQPFTSTDFIWVGDAVRMTHRNDTREGVVRKVTSGRTPYWVDFTNGTSLKCSENILTKLKDEDEARVKAAIDSTKGEVVELKVGEFCQFTDEMFAKYPGIYVVTSVKAGHEYRLSLAGGDPANRYFPSIAGHKLRKLDIELVVK